MPYGIRIQLYPSIQLRAAGIKHLNIKHRNHSEFFQSICLQFSLVSIHRPKNSKKSCVYTKTIT